MLPEITLRSGSLIHLNNLIAGRNEIKLTCITGWRTFVITTKDSGMKPYRKILRWTPRVLCIIAILFISMFAFDAFSPEMTFWQNLGSLLMHLLPTFILIAFLVVAWKWELTGGILITLVGLAATPVIYNLNYQRTQSVNTTIGIILMVTMPFIIIGILFIISYFINRKHEVPEQQEQ